MSVRFLGKQGIGVGQDSQNTLSRRLQVPTHQFFLHAVVGQLCPILPYVQLARHRDQKAHRDRCRRRLEV
jgi:hypothetical protein